MVSKALILAGFLGASVLFGCDDMCKFPEKVYESGESKYRVVKEIDQEIFGSVKIMPFLRPDFIIPNRYFISCGVYSKAGPFDLLVSKVYTDGSYDLLVSSGDPARSVSSNVLSPADLEGVVRLDCSVSIPETWECTYIEVCDELGICHMESVYSLLNEKYQAGKISTSVSSSEDCFDWYYDDPNIVRN